jgi:Domain of unknown function (DUF4384)
MGMRIGVAFTLFSAAIILTAQQQPKLEGARELFYNAMVQKDPPPPARRTQPRASTSGGTAITPVSMAAVHLGLRYNLVLVDADSGRSQSAAPDRMFRTGECFALDIESNRSGFLYVLAKQSSGSWHPLLPSKDEDMAAENNAITAGTKVRIPLKHCFEIENPPGIETLFVVLSREPRDSFDLENMKSPANPQRPAQRPVATVEIADASIADSAVTRMREQFGTRDIAIKKVSQPLAAAEPAESVYVVNSSSSPASNLAAQIEVHHR